MRYARFINKEKKAVYGILEGETLRETTAAPYGDYSFTGEVYGIGSVKLLAPSEPRVIMCAGTNYMEHVKEAKETMPMKVDIPKHPLIFSKAPNAVAAPGQPIEYPINVERVDYEGELAVIIGRRCKKAARETAFSYIAGYTCLNDVSARDWQWNDGQWTRGKGLDTFCPFGPIVTDEIDPSHTRIVTRVNGNIVQEGDTSDMIFDIPALLEYITEWITLEPGDVIATGTPKGVGPIKPGDVVEIEIENIGILKNPVIAGT